MGVFHKKWQGSQHILQFLVINLLCWFFRIAVAQEIDALAKAFDSLNFPMEAITCMVNLLVFGVILIRGRMDLENGAREFLGILRGPKLEEVNGSTDGMGLTTISIEEQNKASTEGGRRLEAASVVMLSKGTPNWSMKQFMKSCAVDDVNSIVLQYQPLQNAAMNDVKVAIGECSTRQSHRCNCIVFRSVEEITIMLDQRMPGTLKSVSNSMCVVLPCLNCLTNSCHGYSSTVEFLSRVQLHGAICEILDEPALQSSAPGERVCMCIPVSEVGHDHWTRQLIKSFKSKDAEDRGVRVRVSEALQDYLDGERRGGKRREEKNYSIGSLIWPRFSEILINFFLTFWFKVDGFSSSFLARRTIRNYLVDSKGSRLAANAFLTKATVQFNADNNHTVRQVLTFRGNGLSFITLSFIMASANLICFIGWAVLIAFDCGDSAPPLTVPRVVIIIAVIGIACIMDCLYMYTNLIFFDQKKPDYKVLFVMIWEIACIAAGIVDIIVVKTPGVVQLNWVYSALQLLVWVKWAIGSYILDKYAEESSGYRTDDWKVLIFSSAFLLNAGLAGARIKWTPTWPWKKNLLFKHFFANPSHNAFDPPLTQC